MLLALKEVVSFVVRECGVFKFVSHQNQTTTTTAFINIIEMPVLSTNRGHIGASEAPLHC